MTFEISDIAHRHIEYQAQDYDVRFDFTKSKVKYPVPLGWREWIPINQEVRKMKMLYQDKYP